MATNRSKTVSFPFFELLKETRENVIYPHFSLKECGFFAQTSKASEEEVAFLRLLPSAVDAESESYKPESYQPGDERKLAAIAILKRHPKLLFRKGLVTDHYDRKILASAYQLFCGTGNIWALKHVHEIIIAHIKDGEAKALVQFREQFPNCPWPFDPNMSEEMLYDARNKVQIAQVTAQLKVIDVKITADACTNGSATLEETTSVVAELCQIYSPKEGEVIQTGLHFPLAIMKEIYKIYDARVMALIHHQANSWSWDQLAFFSREVIGKTLAALTAVDGQCCKYGLKNLDIKIGPDRWDGLFCRHPKGIPENLAPISDKLGRSMFLDPYDGYSCFLTSIAGVFDWYKDPNSWADWFLGSPRFSGNGFVLQGGVTCWTAYGEQKQRYVADVMRQLCAEKPSHRDEQPMRCVIL